MPVPKAEDDPNLERYPNNSDDRQSSPKATSHLNSQRGAIMKDSTEKSPKLYKHSVARVNANENLHLTVTKQ